MLSYNDNSYSELIKKYTLKYLIKHIDNITSVPLKRDTSVWKQYL